MRNKAHKDNDFLRYLIEKQKPALIRSRLLFTNIILQTYFFIITCLCTPAVVLTLTM